MAAGDTVTGQDRADAELMWDYHQLHHERRRCSVGIGLGSHDLGVATLAADLYHAGLFPVLVFSGANSPTTAARFPRGEAVHYAEQAIARGVPEDVIIIEPHATNTGQNIEFSRSAVTAAGIPVAAVMLISKPYMERRAYATMRKYWPEPGVVCASERLSFDDYLESIGDDKLVVDMLVGDLQRLIVYPARGFAIAQEVPAAVMAAYRRLVAAGYDSRLLRELPAMGSRVPVLQRRRADRGHYRAQLTSVFRTLARTITRALQECAADRVINADISDMNAVGGSGGNRRTDRPAQPGHAHRYPV